MSRPPIVAAVLLCGAFHAFAQEEFLQTHSPVGNYGGRLTISQRGEPQTLNPITAADTTSREILSLTTADLIHINRHSLKTEPALASSWSVSADGHEYTLHLRRGIHFSDGHAFDADDVLFTFQVHLDERVHSSQRALLVIAGQPIKVERLDRYTVRFKLALPYANAERLFDGIAVLPRHRLQDAYRKGAIAQAWGLNTPPEQMAGLGPFRFKNYSPGQRATLERNPYYWKKDLKGNRLPYFDAITALFSGDADAETLRFQAGEMDLINRLNASSFSALEKHAQTGGFGLYDAGPGLEYNFLFFNLNEFGSRNLTSIAAKQTWFRQLAFRKAVSLGIDREAISRLAYHGRAHPLWAPVALGNALWVNRSIPHPARTRTGARELLRGAGFSWNKDAHLVDVNGKLVIFSVLVNASNLQHAQTATLIQEDLRDLGMEVRIVPLEFHAFLDRVFKSYEYESAIMSLSSGDVVPNSEMNVWTSSGGTHVWDLSAKTSQEPWQKEIDQLMQRQMITPGYAARKAMYDRVQELLWEYLPLISLVNPNVLVGGTKRLQNFQPAILSNQTLWNVEELSFGR